MPLLGPKPWHTKSPEDAQKYLDALASYVNSHAANYGAEGSVFFHLRESEDDPETWAIKVSGSVSGGQDNDGKEIWQDLELDDWYQGDTLLQTLTRLFKDVVKGFPATPE